LTAGRRPPSSSRRSRRSSASPKAQPWRCNSAARRCGTRRTPYKMGRYVIEKERHEEH